MIAHRRRTGFARPLGMMAVAAATIAMLVACGDDNSGSSESESTSAGSGGAGGSIALLLPEVKTTRYEQFDKPYFEAKVKELSPDTKVLYSNAEQDAAKQQQQAEAALTNGAKVIVLDPVDSTAAASIVNAAKAKDVPVVAYDRFINGAPIAYYISFDNEKVGQLQGTALVDELKAGTATGGIIMINGSPTDNNATSFKKGAHSVIDQSGIKVLAEFDTPDWSPDKAQNFMSSQLTKFSGQIAGVYAANDGTAGGAVAAMKTGNVTPWPPVTGQDAQLDAIQRILAGDQFMTVYKAIKPEAERAAEVAVGLLKGETPEGDTTFEGIPATLLTPVAVTKDNIKDTVVKDGFYTVEQICTSQYQADCTAAGLS